MVKALSSQRLQEETEGMDHENGPSHGNYPKYHPLGKTQGLRDLEPHEMGELEAVNHHHREECHGGGMYQEGSGLSQKGRQSQEKHINSRVHTPSIGNSGPQERNPYQEVAGKFLGPEQGLIQHIAEEHLGCHDDGHGKAHTKEQILHYSVYGCTNPVQPRHGNSSW